MNYDYTEIVAWIVAILLLAFFLWLYFWRLPSLVDERDAATEEFDRQRGLVATHEQKIQDLSTQCDARSAELSTTAGRLRDLEQERDGYTNRIAELERENTSVVAGLRTKIDELEKSSADLVTLRSQFADLEAKNTKLSTDAGAAAGLRNRLAQLEGEVRASQERSVAKEAEIRGLMSQERDGLTARIGMLEQENTDIPGLRNRVKELERENAEIETLHGRIGELEPLSQELRALQKRYADLEARNAELTPRADATDGLRARITELETETRASRTTQEEIRGVVGTSEPSVRTEAADGQRAGIAQLGGTSRDSGAEAGVAVGGLVSEASADFDKAAEIVGRKVRLDDLTMVEGIGPKIAELLIEGGISTWRVLAGTDPALLRELLTAAGPRFQMHDPGTWPEQAGLLAEGRWAEYKALTDRLEGGVAR